MKKMTKIILIVAAALVVLGIALFCIVMNKYNWDFKKLSTANMETKTYTVSDAFRNISVSSDTTDVIFLPSDSEQTKVVCFEEKKVSHSVSVEDGTLVVNSVDTRKWYDHIGINLHTPSITIYLPEKAYASLTVNNTTGDIKVPGKFVFQSMDISATTGDITINSVDCDGDININFTTGDCNLTDTNCTNLHIESTTGDIELRNVISSGQFRLTVSTGDIEFDYCDAAEITAESTTGDISGSFLTNKVVFATTTTGDVDVPKSTSGGRCELTTTTGDIEIYIAK